MREMTSHQKTLKEKNDAFVVHRSLVVQGVQSVSDTNIIQDALANLTGVQDFDIVLKKSKVSITYDATLTNFGAIEEILTKCGFLPKDTRWSRFKSGWYRYLDENAKNNATTKGGACCSKPSGIYANRKK